MNHVLGLVLKKGAPEARAALEVVSSAARGAQILVEDNGAIDPSGWPRHVRLASEGEIAGSAELLVVVGGDGTMIHAASILRERVVPILGVNLGYIGFLTEVARDELTQALPRALEGSLPYVDRMRLDAQVTRNGRVLLSERILNDASLSPHAMARLSQYRISLRGELVTMLRGDGVIVATPTGSTAYSMAAGGAILWPGLRAIAITPICPHSLTQRPLVVGPDGDVVVTLDSEDAVHVTLDGRAGCEFRHGDVLTLREARVPTRLLHAPWRSYFQTLRAKLRWGEA